MFFAHGSNHSCGVMTLIRKDLDFEDESCLCVDFHLLNHFLILAKQHIYSCRNKGYPPSLRTYLAKVSLIYQIETTIAESNGKRAFHDVKWKKFLLK